MFLFSNIAPGEHSQRLVLLVPIYSGITKWVILVKKALINSTPENERIRIEMHKQRLPGCVKFFIWIDALVVIVSIFACGFLFTQFNFIPNQLQKSESIASLGLLKHELEKVKIGEYVPIQLGSQDTNMSSIDSPGSVDTPAEQKHSFSLPFNIKPVDLPEIEQAENWGSPNDFYGINFGNNQERILLTITPADSRVNKGKPIVIPFYPARTCEFGDKSACVTTYLSDNGARIIFVSVHSGVGGQAQRFRNAIEGTGINQAGFDLEKVQNKMGALLGAQVSIRQGENETSGFAITATSRIPAQSIADYLDTPASGGLRFAAGLDPGLGEFVNPDVPQLVIETCGWKLRGEPGAEEVAPTTASVYLALIQRVD